MTKGGFQLSWAASQRVGGRPFHQALKEVGICQTKEERRVFWGRGPPSRTKAQNGLWERWRTHWPVTQGMVGDKWGIPLGADCKGLTAPSPRPRRLQAAGSRPRFWSSGGIKRWALFLRNGVRTGSSWLMQYLRKTPPDLESVTGF